MTTTIAFIGLGTMGLPMAGCLVAGGYTVRGTDIDPARSQRLAELGGMACESIAQACQGAQVAITMLPKDEHVRRVILGQGGVADSLQAGALVIDMSTVLPETVREVGAQLRQRGLAMLDAPVGRTPEDARKGNLLVMLGGDDESAARALPLFSCLAEKTLHVGPLGAGATIKVINNYMSMVSMVMTAETLTMAVKAGIDVNMAVEVLQNTVAGKGQINTNFPKKVLAGDVTPDFPIELGLKDVSLALSLGRSLGAPLFLGASAAELFSLAKNQGRARQDCTAMFLALQELAGVPSPLHQGDNDVHQ